MRPRSEFLVAAFCLVGLGIGCRPGADSEGTRPAQGSVTTPNDTREDSGQVPVPTSQHPHQQKTDQRPSKPPEPAEPVNPRIAEFREAMKKFIEEARSLSRTMDLVPEQASYNRRIESVQDAYSRIPDPPADNEPFALCYKAARQITTNFELGTMYLEIVARYLRINSQEGADENVKNFRDLGKRQKIDLDELEAAVNDGRVPKVELSDAVKSGK